MATKKHTRSDKNVMASESLSISPREGPLVFISHDTRDADLAEAFANLLMDVSGGMLKSFRSSDRKGTAGIEFGQEWYTTIMANLAKSTDVVALLTPHSLNRPWILYESGVAKGKMDATVLGVAIGISLDQTQTGPFAQFQNCGDDEDSLTKLVMQLIRRNPSANPRDEAVRLQVHAFRDKMVGLLKTRGKAAEHGPKIDDAVIAKMFEEVKILVRDLPDRLQNGNSNARHRRSRRFHPGMIEDFFRHPMFCGNDAKGASLLVYLSLIKEDYPWLYEFGIELYRAIQKGNGSEIERARARLLAATEASVHGPLAFENEDSYMFLRHMSQDIDRLIARPSLPLPRRKPRPSTGEQAGLSS